MSENVLLWGIWFDDRNGGHWHGSTTKGAVMTWDSDNVQYAYKLAKELNGQVAPYLTLAKVLEAYESAKAAALKNVPALQRKFIEQINKLGGL